jgi:hypothetical protein
MFKMIKEPEQLIAAAEIYKVACELRADKLANDTRAHASLNLGQWHQVNPPLAFVEQAYRTLVAVAAQIQAVQGKDDGEASMREIDSMLNKPNK